MRRALYMYALLIEQKKSSIFLDLKLLKNPCEKTLDLSATLLHMSFERNCKIEMKIEWDLIKIR